MSPKASSLLTNISLLLLGILLGCASMNFLAAPRLGPPPSRDSFQLYLLAEANSLGTATDTVALLNDGELLDAKEVLDGQIRASLTMLRAIAPTVKLPADKKRIVEDSIAKGEAYMAGKKANDTR